MTFTRTAEEIARDEYDEAQYNSPEAQAFFAAEAEQAHFDAYTDWKYDRMQDEPGADPATFSMDAFNEYLESFLMDD